MVCELAQRLVSVSRDPSAGFQLERMVFSFAIRGSLTTMLTIRSLLQSAPNRTVQVQQTLN